MPDLALLLPFTTWSFFHYDVLFSLFSHIIFTSKDVLIQWKQSVHSNILISWKGHAVSLFKQENYIQHYILLSVPNNFTWLYIFFIGNKWLDFVFIFHICISSNKICERLDIFFSWFVYIFWTEWTWSLAYCNTWGNGFAFIYIIFIPFYFPLYFCPYSWSFSYVLFSPLYCI